LLKNKSGRIHASTGILNNEGALDENTVTSGNCLFPLFPKNKQIAKARLSRPPAAIREAHRPRQGNHSGSFPGHRPRQGYSSREKKGKVTLIQEA
jgi:hypothetical protein